MSDTKVAPMKLRIRNVMGVRKADATLQGILLVGGRNAAGKSSLLQSVACALLRTPVTRGQTTRKALANLVHEGAAAGSVMLDYGVGSVRITYPSGDIEEVGKPVEFGTALGLGSELFMDLKPEARLREISERFKTTPEKADLVEWFRDHPEPPLSEDAVTALWESIDISGFDAVHKQAVEHGRKIKGRWELLAGRKFGETIAATWCPTMLMPGEEYTTEAAQAELDGARAALEKLVVAEAITADRRAHLETAVRLGEEAKVNVVGLQETGTKLAAEVDALIQQRAEKGNPEDTSTSPQCPHCRGRLRLVRAPAEKGGAVTIQAAPDDIPAAKLKELRLEIASLDGQIDNIKVRMQEHSKLLVGAQQLITNGIAATAELAKQAKLPKLDEAAIATQRETVLELERKVAAVKALLGAAAEYQDYLANVSIVRALEPEGVRQTVLTRKLSEVSALLSAMSQLAKFPEVAIGVDMEATLDGRTYALLSESEQWRVDLVITAVLGRREGARALLIDRLDVLDAPSRSGVLKMTKGLGVPVLIGMTGKEASALPQLMKVKLGIERWMEKGVLLEPGDVGAAA